MIVEKKFGHRDKKVEINIFATLNAVKRFAQTGKDIHFRRNYHTTKNLKHMQLENVFKKRNNRYSLLTDTNRLEHNCIRKVRKIFITTKN